MVEFISKNVSAYEVAYEAMYPEESNCHRWGDIEAEWFRVRLLNSRRPAGADDIKTYGSRIAAAVLKSVNPVAKFFNPKKEKGRAD